MKRSIDMEQSPFAFINLVCVQSVIQLMNTPFITLYYDKRLFHFFFKNDYCQDFAKPFSLLVRGYIEVKINKHEIW